MNTSPLHLSQIRIDLLELRGQSNADDYHEKVGVAPGECRYNVEELCKSSQSSTIGKDEKDLRIIRYVIGSNWVSNRWAVVGAVRTDRDGQKMFG